MPKKTTTKEEPANGGDVSAMSIIKDALIDFVTTFFQNMIEQIKADLQVQAEKFALDAKKMATFAFLLLMGVIFLLVGIAIVVDQVTGIKGLGFVIVGAVLVAVGFLFNLANKKAE